MSLTPQEWLRREIANLDTIKALREQLSEQAKEIERLKDENHSLGNEIDALEEEGCAADDTIRAAESRVSALSAEVERMTKLLEGRDQFIVNHDLWADFVASLPSASLNGGSDHG